VTQICVCGYGGQGVVLAGTILGHAAITDDKWVAGSNSYGAQARGGAARSEVVIATHPIIYPHVIQADILIAMSQTAYDTYKHTIAEQGACILYDDMIVHPEGIPGVHHIGIPATKTALDAFKTTQVANMVMLGAAAAMTTIVSKKSLIFSIQTQVAHRFREVNKKALTTGFTLGKKYRQKTGITRNQINHNGS
jgi:2-oxoglutarate ferredoxin oxidoreductase subunit gamma